MTTYRIVCSTLSATAGTSGHKHLVDVGTGADPNKATDKWTIAQVRTSLDAGNTFYTEVGGKRAEVRTFDCDCGIHTIRSHADGYWNNNLDNLRTCHWQ